MQQNNEMEAYLYMPPKFMYLSSLYAPLVINAKLNIPSITLLEAVINSLQFLTTLLVLVIFLAWALAKKTSRNKKGGGKLKTVDYCLQYGKCNN